MTWNQILSVIWLKSIIVLWFNLFHIEKKKFFRLNQFNFWLLVSSQFYIHFRLKYHIFLQFIIFYTSQNITLWFLCSFQYSLCFKFFFVFDLFNFKINKYRYLPYDRSYSFFIIKIISFVYQFSFLIFIFFHFIYHYCSFISFSLMMLLLSNEKLKMLL